MEEYCSKEACKVINSWMALSGEDRDDVMDFLYERCYGSKFRDMLHDRAVKQKSVEIGNLKSEMSEIKDEYDKLRVKYVAMRKKAYIATRHRQALSSLWSSIPKNMRTSCVPDNLRLEIRHILGISPLEAEREMQGYDETEEEEF